MEEHIKVRFVISFKKVHCIYVFTSGVLFFDVKWQNMKQNNINMTYERKTDTHTYRYI